MVSRPVRSAVASLALLVLGTPLLAAPAPDLAALPDNFGEVTPWLYRGSQPSKDELRELARIGVRTVIDLRRGTRSSMQRLAAELGIDYVTIPMSARQEMSDADIAAFLAIVDDPARRPVYVHCLAGKHRTGVMVALYRVLREEMSGEAAYEEMEKYHFAGRFPALRDYVYARANTREDAAPQLAAVPTVEVASGGAGAGAPAPESGLGATAAP